MGVKKIKEFTQEQLAEDAGTSTNFIGTIEIGKKLIENFAQFVENQFV